MGSVSDRRAPLILFSESSHFSNDTPAGSGTIRPGQRLADLVPNSGPQHFSSRRLIWNPPSACARPVRVDARARYVPPRVSPMARRRLVLSRTLVFAVAAFSLGLPAGGCGHGGASSEPEAKVRLTK